jgi:molybdopterin converting factor subunit 1
MQVRVLYFAALRELAHTGEETLSLGPETRSLADLRAELERRRPELRGRLGAVRLALNETFAEPGTLLSGGDVVALIPPVAGG